jgi:uncharacterized protein YdhG (YjbR/CyaY superfamily)
MWQCPKCKCEFENINQDHYCGELPKTIDEYIEAQLEEVRPILVEVRETIRSAAPKATEKISWNMPTFWQGENLIHFAAFKKHLGIYPGDLSFAPFKERIASYSCTKGAIQFPYDKPIDYELISDIVRWRISCVEGKNKSNNDMDKSKMTRNIYDIPDYITAALDKSGLWENYHKRPPYQRNDYIGWITRGKREETRRKRLKQMLEELKTGDAYMGMAYKVN